MDNFEKIELIVSGRLKQRTQELDRLRDNSDIHPAYPFVVGVEHEVDTLQQVLNDINEIIHYHHSVREELLLKMYGSLK